MSSARAYTRLLVYKSKPFPSLAHTMAVLQYFDSNYGGIRHAYCPRDPVVQRPGNALFLHLLEVEAERAIRESPHHIPLPNTIPTYAIEDFRDNYKSTYFDCFPQHFLSPVEFGAGNRRPQQRFKVNVDLSTDHQGRSGAPVDQGPHKHIRGMAEILQEWQKFRGFSSESAAVASEPKDLENHLSLDDRPASPIVASASVPDVPATPDPVESSIEPDVAQEANEMASLRSSTKRPRRRKAKPSR